MKFNDIQLTGNLLVTGSLTIPAGTTAERPTNPRSGSVRLNTTLGVMEIYTATSGSEWATVGEQTAPVPYVNTDIEYLLVAGGGAGGGGNYNSGGGGAGGLLSSSLASVQSGSSFTVTVGAGGTGAATQGNEGTDSTIAGATISTITSIGGGGGGSHSDNPYSGTDGGSGGGGTQGTGAGGSGTVGQGNNGTGLWYGTGGGGGGAGESGSVGFGNVPPYPRGSQSDIDGGDGLQTNITGTPTYFAGGGGGGERVALSVVRGNGGAGGGGQGGPDAGAGSAGTSNTGGGGGGSGGNDTSTRSGGSGGSGVAIFAYNSGSFNGAGGIVGDAGNGRKYHQFNQSDTFKVGSTSDFQIVTSNLLLNFDAGNFASRGTSTVTDLSGNGNNGTVGNATLNDYHYSFNGSNSYITAPPTSFVSNAYSVETWLYKASIDSTYDCIFAFGFEMQSYFRSNFIEFYIDTNGSSPYEVNGIQLTGLSAATWYHYTVTDNGSGTVNMYLNGGTQTNTTTYTGNPGVYSGTPRIGDYPPSPGAYPFNGNIAQFRIYTKALSAAEVLQNYNATKTNFV